MQDYLSRKRHYSEFRGTMLTGEGLWCPVLVWVVEARKELIRAFVRFLSTLLLNYSLQAPRRGSRAVLRGTAPAALPIFHFWFGSLAKMQKRSLKSAIISVRFWCSLEAVLMWGSSHPRNKQCGCCSSSSRIEDGKVKAEMLLTVVRSLSRTEIALSSLSQNNCTACILQWTLACCSPKLAVNPCF